MVDAADTIFLGVKPTVVLPVIRESAAELRDKLDKETDRIREEIRTKHGTLNIAVELIHEAREGV